MSSNNSIIPIDSDCSIIKKNATELREIISQISEGSTLLVDKEGEIFEMIDEIKENSDSISSKATLLVDKVTNLEEEASNRESNDKYDTTVDQVETDTMLGKLVYCTDNLMDADIMEEFVKCIACVKPSILLEQLKSMHPNYRGA